MKSYRENPEGEENQAASLDNERAVFAAQQAALLVPPPTPPTYPIRPMNGGRLDQAAPRIGNWLAEPKYNDMRVWLHTPTGNMWNRHLEPVSPMVKKRFEYAASTVPDYWESDRIAKDPATHCPEWLDCLALGTRTTLGAMLEKIGRLLIIDYLSDSFPAGDRRLCNVMQVDRCAHLRSVLPIARVDMDPVVIPLVSTVERLQPNLETWQRLQDINAKYKVELFEGLVLKRLEGLYPLQLVDASRESKDWLKYRFIRG